MKIQINIEKRHLMIFIAVIAIAAIGVVLAAKPNPGHSWSELENWKQSTEGTGYVRMGSVLIEWGQGSSINLVGDNAETLTFANDFSSNPFVIAGLDCSGSGHADLDAAAAVKSISTSQVTIEFDEWAGVTQSCRPVYVAFGAI